MSREGNGYVDSSLPVYFAVSRGFANADGADRASAGVGAIRGPDVHGLIRADVIGSRSIHTKCNLALPIMLVNADGPTEDPMVFDKALVGGLPVRETCEDFGTSIDNINKENTVLDHLVFYVLGNCLSRAVEFGLCLAGEHGQSVSMELQ